MTTRQRLKTRETRESILPQFLRAKFQTKMLWATPPRKPVGEGPASPSLGGGGVRGSWPCGHIPPASAFSARGPCASASCSLLRVSKEIRARLLQCGLVWTCPPLPRPHVQLRWGWPAGGGPSVPVESFAVTQRKEGHTRAPRARTRVGVGACVQASLRPWVRPLASEPQFPPPYAGGTAVKNPSDKCPKSGLWQSPEPAWGPCTCSHKTNSKNSGTKGNMYLEQEKK